MKNLIIALLLLAQTFSITLAQYWDKVYEGCTVYGFSGLTNELSDSGFALTSSPYHLMRFNKYGDTLWTNNYAMPDDFWMSVAGIKANTDGGFIIVGSCTHTTGEITYICLIRTDSEGHQIWRKEFADSATPFGLHEGWEIDITADGGYIIAGYAGYYRIYVICADENGDTLEDGHSVGWTRIFTLGTAAFPIDVVALHDGGCVITGNYYTTAGYDSCLGYLLRLDSNGNIVWFRNYESSQARTGFSTILPLFDGGFILCGTSLNETTPWIEHSYTVRTDSAGGIIWELESDSIPIGNACLVCDSAFVRAGTWQSDEVEDSTCGWICKFNIDGELLWSRIICSHVGSFHNVALCPDGGLICVGVAGDSVLWLVKTDSLGNLDWIREIPQKPQGISISNSPNPFNTTTAIYFTLPSATDVSLEIYDILGSKVRTLVQKHLDAGAHRIVWNGADDMNVAVPSGVYFYRLRANGATITRKMALVK